MQFRIGVIGATGYIGTPYRKEIRESDEDAKIVALCARRRDLLETAQREDGADLITNDWRQVVEHPDVNLIIIATPDALHYEPAMASAERGLHLLCEKPVGINSQQSRDIWNAYRDKPLAHFVPFWTRYVPVFQRTRKMVQRGDLGEIRAVIYRWHNPRPMAMPFTWRDNAELSSAGSIADVGSHAYDTMRWILGEEATRVLTHANVITDAKPDLGEVNLGEALEWGQAHQVGESDVSKKGNAFDYANVAFEFTNGAVGSLVLSHAPYLRKGFAPELELHGTEASLGVDRISEKLLFAKSGQHPEQIEELPHDGTTNRFATHVFPAIRAKLADGSREHPNLEDGYRVQLFTDAASASAKAGQWMDVSR